ncbi:hypothetical protein LSH36_1498g00002 [Paralvinella palmiformis]|uniref:Uncharacterized protein n=1 Tax=Paralvinella palmiformis TaxID=53620 RepID=A0AAD9ISB4_9ANNE|nr:hypothetical protein LSH36_1498g00002 [Paralvinella palmiformis]
MISILAVVCLVIIIVITVVIVVVLRRRGFFTKQEAAGEDSKINPPGGRRKTIVGVLPMHSKLYTNFSRVVKLEDFADHYRKMCADSCLKFDEEYEGYNSKREFIASQGPLPGTVEDHWRMIWEYNCQAIVMLANCKEGKKDKCDHYWPHDREPMFYGDLQVQIVKKTRDKEHEPDYIITQMTGEQVRKISHFHFVKWPDFGVPNNPESLIAYVKKVRNSLSCDGGPTVVHCSAGVGRTGTFIALDRLLQTIDEYDAVDIYSIVHEMRMNRPLMVQTKTQYMFVHQCLKYELELRKMTNNAYNEDKEQESIYMNA